MEFVPLKGVPDKLNVLSSANFVPWKWGTLRTVRGTVSQLV